MAFFVMTVSVSFFVVNGNAYADRNFSTRAECITKSNHPNIRSVYTYACQKAFVKSDGSAGTQNACATWLASAGDSRKTEIEITALDGTYNNLLKFYGMCTDADDTTSTLSVKEMVGNNSVPANYIIVPDIHFLRRGGSTAWGNLNNLNSMNAPFNVGAFVNGRTLVKRSDGKCVYKANLIVRRSHSDGQSSDTDYTTITVVAPEGTVCTEPDPDPQFCDLWTPSSFMSSGVASDGNSAEGTTSVVEKVKNSRLIGSASGWQDTTYAMPGDTGTWQSCYYPGVQKLYDKEIWRTYIEGNKDVNNDNRRPWDTSVGWGWENKYYFNGSNMSALPSGENLNLGVTDVKSKTNDETTDEDDAGKTFSQSIYSGKPSYQKVINQGTQPFTCDVNGNPVAAGAVGPTGAVIPTYTCYKYKNDYWYSERSDGAANATAKLVVPYNYKNYTGVSIDTSQPVYAGEVVKISEVWTQVDPRQNDITEYYYATRVPNAKISLIAYVTKNPSGGTTKGETSNDDICSVMSSVLSDEDKPKQCKRFEKEEIIINGKKGLNRDGNLEGASESFWHGKTYSAFDASAGDYLCLVSAVWPSASNGNTDTSENGNGKWRYSDPSCVAIAKKPTFQVWGGDMYSNAGLDGVSQGAKRNIYNYYIGDIKNRFKESSLNPSLTFFGSWIEQGLVVNHGKANKVSSGASVGINPSSQARVGSNLNATLCDRSPLTFANILCDSSIIFGDNEVGDSGIDAGVEDRTSLIDYWISTPSAPSYSGEITLNDNIGTLQESATGANMRYLPANDDLIIHSSTIGKGTTLLIKAENKNITIDGDIRYTDAGYAKLSEISKVIIYAKNINIACRVNEIDAILIAENNVNTCSDRAADGNPIGTNDVARSNQLKIFGVSISDGVVLGRTYGSAAWNPDYKINKAAPCGSNNVNCPYKKYANGTDGLAAEVFDYDSTMLMWSEYMSDAAETDTLQTVYQHELAPRY